MEYLFLGGDFKGSAPRWDVAGQRLMKSLLFNTNYLIYLRLPSLYLISFGSAAVH